MLRRGLYNGMAAVVKGVLEMCYNCPVMPAYREPLPADCPPPEAEEIIRPRLVFRLVQSDPPADRDFQSQRALNPERPYRRVTECQARGLSVFSDRRDAEARLKRRNLRGMRLCQVFLSAGAGYIQQTGDHSPTHYTWWPLAEFNILPNCQVVS